MYGAYPRQEEKRVQFDMEEESQPEYADALYDFVTVTVMGDPAKKAGIALSLLRYYLGITH